MLYLETLLRTMDCKADVMVMLSSVTIYGEGEIENPIKMQDCCGNHHTINWLKAIRKNHLENVFRVKDVSVSFEDWMDAPQWKVILENEKGYETKTLDIESNKAAIEDAFKI